MRQPVLMAYTKTTSEVYIIGLPFGLIALIASVFMKNSRMPTKAEEQASIQEIKEKAALAARAEGKTDVEVEKAAEAAATARQEQQVAQAITLVNAEPPAVVEGGPDAQVMLAVEEGRSPV